VLGKASSPPLAPIGLHYSLSVLTWRQWTTRQGAENGLRLSPEIGGFYGSRPGIGRTFARSSRRPRAAAWLSDQGL